MLLYSFYCTNLFWGIVDVLPVPKVFTNRPRNQMMFGNKWKESSSTESISWVTCYNTNIFHTFTHFYVFSSYVSRKDLAIKWWRIFQVQIQIKIFRIAKFLALPVSSFVLHIMPLLSFKARLTKRSRASRLNT